MKLPNDIKQAITKELIEELHTELKYHCIQCSSPSGQYLCSAECLKEDIEKRQNGYNVIKLKRK